MTTYTCFWTTLPLPGNVSGLSSSAGSVNSLTMAFTGASGATSHQEQHRLSPSGSWSSPATIINGGILIGLTTATAYDVQVRGVGAYGNGSWSSTATASTASSGLLINITFDATALASASTIWKNCVLTAAAWLQTLFSNPVTLAITVGYGEDGSGNGLSGTGASNSIFGGPGYSGARAALLAQSAQGSATLPSTSPLSGVVYATQANVKALGLFTSGGSVDGTCGFGPSSMFGSFTEGVAPASGYYMPGTVKHELTEIMGRQSLIDSQPTYYTPADLFRYTAAGARALTSYVNGGAANAFFSLDGGTTLLREWNNRDTGFGDLGDWLGGSYPVDACNGYGSLYVVAPFSTHDVLEMNAIGWTLTAAGMTAAGL